MRQLQITPTITNRETASVELYFNEISKEALITAQEEVILAQKIKQGDRSALNKLVSANLRFVVSVAKKYQFQEMSLSDLINEGNLGLIKAAERFDETRGFKFISFAVWWIRQSIIQAITENARIVRLPMNKVNEITKINRAICELEQKTECQPTPELVAEYLGFSEERVIEALACAPWSVSADAPVSEDGYTMMETFSSSTRQPDADLIDESSKTDIEQLLNLLTDRERKIISMSFGINGGRALTPVDIAKEIGITSERTRQIRNHALNKLRFASNVSLEIS